MTTFVINEDYTGTLQIGPGVDVIVGRDTFWNVTLTDAPAIELGGNNTIFVAGQIYSESDTFESTNGANRIDIAATGILVSTAASAMLLGGPGNSVANAGYVSGLFGLTFLDADNSVFNTGTITAGDDAVRCGAGAGGWVTNAGSIVSTGDDAVQFFGNDVHNVVNSGIISAVRSTAVNDLSSSGFLLLANGGTITGLLAIQGGGGADRIANSGIVVGAVNLGAGDDLFDTALGVTEGIVSGEAGNDTLLGSAIEDRFAGGTGDDTLAGNAGNDRLTGGAGADELDGGAGTDGAHYATATAAVRADLAGTIANLGDAAGDSFTGIENLVGSDFDDALYGDALGNRLTGGLGVDLLDGRAGADVLRGGDGSDLYFVDNRGDRVVEFFGDGFDGVSATIDYTLPDFVEVLTLIGPAAINGFGNALDNRITGNAAANVIDGGAGFDVLVGGGGADRFRFTSQIVAADADIVDDFEIGIDKLVLSRSVFTTLNGGTTLIANRFAVGSAAQDANDRIIYDPVSGALFYDSDGTGSAAQIIFAGLDTGLMLTASDIQLIG